MKWVDYVNNFILTSAYIGNNNNRTNKYGAMMCRHSGVIWAQSCSNEELCSKNWLTYTEVRTIFDNLAAEELTIMGRKVLQTLNQER
jgi:hypothetical protein